MSVRPSTTKTKLHENSKIQFKKNAKKISLKKNSYKKNASKKKLVLQTAPHKYRQEDKQKQEKDENKIEGRKKS